MGTQRLGRIRSAQLIGCTVDGLVLSTVVVHATTSLGLTPASVGAVLAAAALVALVGAVPIGALADRLGLRRSAILLGGVAVLALVAYGVARGPGMLTVGAVLFATSQLGLGAVRQAVVAATVVPERRVVARAGMQALANAGIGLGAGLGAWLIAADGRWIAPGYLVAALASASCVVLFLGLPRDTTVRSGRAAWDPVALRDRRFLAATGLAGLVQLTMPILSVILPAWILLRTDAPLALAAVALAVNTGGVIVLQARIAARVDDHSARRVGVVAAIALVGAVLTFATAPLVTGAVGATVIVLVAVALLTVGEMLGGALSWHVAFAVVPASAHGRYQSTFAISSSIARILGPLVFLPLVLAAPWVGWSLQGALTAAACLALAASSGRRTSERAHGPRGVGSQALAAG